jgi:hypothetical protein
MDLSTLIALVDSEIINDNWVIADSEIINEICFAADQKSTTKTMSLSIKKSIVTIKLFFALFFLLGVYRYKNYK